MVRAQFNTRFNNLPGFSVPSFQNPPISFATGNANDGQFFNTVFAIDPNIQTQKNYEFNFGVQREIGFDTAIELRYVGGRSNSLVRAFDFNQVQIGNNGFLRDFIAARTNCQVAIANFNATMPNQTPRFLDGGCSPSEYNGTTGLPGQVNIPDTSPIGALIGGGIEDFIAQGIPGELALIYIINGLNGPAGGVGANLVPNVNAGVVDFLTNSGRYRYNAFQAEIRRRFTQGLSFQANYTFSKVLADVLSDQQTRFDPFLDRNNAALEFARADYDRTHTVNINANYELPFGKGKPFLNQGGITDAIFGGFQFSSIINISSGTPISIKDINGTLNRTGRSNRQTANSSLTPEQIKDLIGIFKVNGRIYYIDPSVIAPSGSATGGNVLTNPDSRFTNQVFFRAQPGQTGNLPRNFIDGPMYFNWDASLIKNINFSERFRLQLRADAFNVLNNVNFFIAENSGIFDVDTSTFGQISPGSTYDPRIFQFAARFEF